MCIPTLPMNPTLIPAPITQAPATIPTITVPLTTAAPINTVSTTLSLPANINNCVTYTAVTGDTCWGIASKFGITLNQLISLNLNVNCNNLQVGQIICVQSIQATIITNPTLSPTLPTTALPTVTTKSPVPFLNCVTYTIMNGDTCLGNFFFQVYFNES